LIATMMLDARSMAPAQFTKPKRHAFDQGVFCDLVAE
jgi:hypothetical protein